MKLRSIGVLLALFVYITAAILLFVDLVILVTHWRSHTDHLMWTVIFLYWIMGVFANVTKQVRS